MNMTRRSIRARTAPGFSLVETTVAIIIVGGLFVTAVDTVGASRLGMQHADRHGRAALLAQQLMSEVLANAYEEPDDLPKFGREGSESGVNRSAYDDVDDYDGWTASRPQDGAGVDIPGMTSWSRSVTVEFAMPDDLMATSGSDQGIKRITVTVSYDGAIIASLVAIRTSAGDQMK